MQSRMSIEFFDWELYDDATVVQNLILFFYDKHIKNLINMVVTCSVTDCMV